MAKAKVGGTSGKRRGYVGDTLYQLTRNEDGKLIQIQRAKELSREYSNTDQQALNRMLMGTIEMAMATCKGYYIRKILNKITLVGALFLSIVAILPMIAGPHIFSHLIEWILGVSTSYAQSIASQFTFGGTSLLIVVGVVLETFRELEAQLTMRSYKGFLN